MRNFIRIVESIDPSSLNDLFRSVAEHFEKQGLYFFEGDCLNFAVAMHQVLSERGVRNNIMAVMRSDGEDGEETRLSHFVVEVDGETYDSQGDNAEQQWEIDFNQIRRENGEEEEMFWLEPISHPIPAYIDTTHEEHGDETKLLNKPELRQQIIEVANSILDRS